MTREQKSKLRCRFKLQFNPTLKALFLFDRDRGLSITNDADNVIEWLFEQNLIRNGERVIYRDTYGRWDELLHRDGKFTGFQFIGVRTLYDAAIQVAGLDMSLEQFTTTFDVGRECP